MSRLKQKNGRMPTSASMEERNRLEPALSNLEQIADRAKRILRASKFVLPTQVALSDSSEMLERPSLPLQDCRREPQGMKVGNRQQQENDHRKAKC